MKNFSYQVRDANGTMSSGVLEASDIKQAASVLKSKGFIITALGEEDTLGIGELLAKLSKPKEDDVANFTRQLATMVGAGLPLVEALKILKNQASPAMKIIVDKIMTEIEGGATLADSLKISGEIFSPVYIALVRAGESAGVLDQVLIKLADNLDRSREFKSKTKGAMIYPAIIMIGMVVIGFVMMVFVMPKLTSMYKDFGAELPTPTKILMGISDVMVKFWYILLLVGAGIGYGGVQWGKTEVGALIYEQISFKIPILGKLKKDMIMTEFARTVAVLLTSGVPILDALRIVADTLGSKIYGAAVKQAAVYLEKGVSFAESVTRVEVFPPILSQMIVVGEETGKMDDVLNKLAKFYEGESETTIKALTTAIEPVIMVIMGVGVGFLVIAVIMPIYNLTSQF